MNRIFKVIWSKTKNCYVVASELAKGRTKAASTGDKAKRLALAAITALMLLPVGGYSYAANISIGTAIINDSDGNQTTVFTGNQTAAEAVEAAVELTVPYNSQQIGILQDAVQNVEKELAQHQSLIDNLGTDKLTLSSDNTLQKETYDSTTKTTTTTNVTGLKVAGPISANSASISGTLSAGGAVNAGSVNSRGNITAVGTIAGQTVTATGTIKGKDLIGTNSIISQGTIAATGNISSQATVGAKEMVSQTNITAKNKVVGIQGVVDNTLTSGNYITAGNTVGENIVALDTQVKANANAINTEATAREKEDARLNSEIVNTNKSLNEAATNLSKLNTAVVDGFKTLKQADENEAVARKAADEALDSRAKALEDKTEAITYDKDSKTVMVDGKLTATEGITDGTMRDGKYVKLDKYVGQNLNALDQGLQAETSARVTADTKLVEATNGGLSLGDGNVLQTNTTTIDAATGEVTTSKTDANEMILNKDKANQITLNENGIKVGTNSTVVDKDGVYTGGDTFDAAKAAMSSDGQIKGANGKFTVDASGNTTVTSLDAGTGTIQTKGDLYAKDATFSGDITAKDATLSGDLSAKDGTFSGDLSAKDGTFSGDVSAKDVTATGTLQGAEVTDGTATMKNGNITGVKDLSAETITTSGDATIGGDLTVNGKLNVDEIDLTKSGIVGDNNVTASTNVAAGEITSYKKATSTKDGSEKEAAFDYDENGTSTWAKATDADGNWKKSTLTVEGSDVTSKVVDSDKNSNESKQTSTESSDVVKDADGNTSTFSQRVKDILQEIKNASGDTLTKVEQTDTAITSQIGDGSAVKSEMTADGITNTAVGGTITNSAKDLVNTATGDMTNTVGGKMLNDVTGDMENKVGGNLTTMVGGNETHTVGGTLTETVTGKATENYNGGLETTITGEEKHTVNGDQTNTITGKQTTTVIGDVREDYKANLSTTVGGNQTTTVTGDSSLTAENITNEAKNKITNKALDVETDASSSIVSKVSNEYGSNTSTQLSYQTTEEMSQADGKKATYLRGAAEEKSQLTDGDKKTTIDTIAGQTNTNITDGTNTSNNLQKADQVASSVTDGTNTTVVNQDAKSLASSITDGTKANNSSNTVDKSEQLIKASDTQYSATSKTATKMEDALVSGSNIIDVIKGLDAAGNPLISSAVTDGTTITGIIQNAKDINLSAAGGTITNDAQNITNKAAETLSNSAKNIANTTTEDMTNTIGKNLKTTVGGDMSTEVTGSQSTTVKGNQSNTVEGTLTETVTGKATENYNGGLETTITGEEKHTVNGNQTNNITGNQTNTIGGAQTTTVTGDSSLSAQNITNTASEKITSQIGNDGKVKSEMTADGITNTAEGGTIYNKSKDILNEASGDILNFADGEIGNVATKITNITGDTTVTSDTNGTTFENKAHNTAIKEGTVTKTTISGNTIETGQATMDYAEVMKDLGVHGNATVDGNTMLGKEGADTTLTVNSKSTFKDTVKMEKTLEVDGTSTFNDKVTVTKGGLDVTGGTTTDTLHVTSSSTFDGAATFKDVVTMEKDLSVGGNATVAGSMTASSYKVGDKTYISESGINANNQKVVNVAAGDLSANSTDAVNGAQLYQTNERVTGVENKVNKLDSRVDKVGANAAALANLHPLEFDADSKWNIAAAVGGYKGETATAIGAFYRPNENVMVNVSSSFGTGENMYGGGISLRIGQGGNKARRNATNGLTEREKAMQKQIDSLTSRLDALLSVINPNMSKDFPDVPENHWAYEAVSRLAGNGVIQGYEDGKYHGDRTMTRYEMAEIIYNALSKGAKAEKKLVEEFKPELQAMAAQKKA